MSNMISELRAVGHDMIDEQQVQAMIRHVELKEDQLLVRKLVQEAFMIKNKSRGA